MCVISTCRSKNIDATVSHPLDLRYSKLHFILESVILNAEIIKHLSDANIPFESKILEGILKEKIAEGIKKIIKLDDPLYAKHINAAAESSFVATWTQDNASVPTELRQFVDDELIRPIFARDFGASWYFTLEKTGEKKRIDFVDEFHAFTKSEKNRT